MKLMQGACSMLSLAYLSMDLMIGRRCLHSKAADSMLGDGRQSIQTYI